MEITNFLIIRCESVHDADEKTTPAPSGAGVVSREVGGKERV
jgi:hypothetical protein